MIVSKLKQRSKRKIIVFTFTVVTLGLLAWLVNSYISLETLVQQEVRIREAIAANPLLSFFIGYVVYQFLALVPGTGGKAIVYGWLFGFWQAVLIVSVGLTIGAMAIFSLSRYLVRESIERRYTSFLSIMNKHLEKEGAFYLLTLRLAHAPYSIVNPVSGASRVRAWTFFWTTALGLLPANAIWVYVGLNLPSLQDLVSRGPEAFLSTPLIITIAVCAVLPFLTRWLISRFGLPGADKEHDATIHKPYGENL